MTSIEGKSVGAQSDGSTLASLVACWMALVIVVDQVSQVLMGSPTWDPGVAHWRFGLATQAVSHTPALALALAAVIAAAERAGRLIARRVALGGLGALGGLLLVALASLWWDGPSVRDRVSGLEIEAFLRRWATTTAITAFGLLLFACVVGHAWWDRRPERPKA